MGMSTYVVGIKPPDEKWMKMKAAWEACRVAKIPVPKEIRDFFNDEEPDEAGVVVTLSKPVVKEWKDDMREGFEVDVTKLDPDIKIIRFYNSW